MEKLQHNQAETVNSILDSTKTLCSADEVLAVMEYAPYFSSLAVAWLERLCRDNRNADTELCDARREIARKAVVAMPDQPADALYRMAGMTRGEIDEESFYPPEKPLETPTTNATIDRFLSTYTHSNSEEESLIERLIFNPVPDYASVLAERESVDLPDPDEAPAGSDDALINSFILKNHDKENRQVDPLPSDVASRPLVAPVAIADGRPVIPPPPPRDDSTLRESLAKFYIKRKRYRKAYEIIEQLNLNNPEKNIYFAPQLRFLAKLIANEEARQRRESKSSE